MHIAADTLTRQSWGSKCAVARGHGLYEGWLVYILRLFQVGVDQRRAVGLAREALLDAAEEPGRRVDGRRRLHADHPDGLVRVVGVEHLGLHGPVGHRELELEAAEHHHDRDRGLEQREGVADALALARAEGQHRVVGGDLEVGHPQPGGAPLGVVAGPALDLVVVEGVVPPLRVEDVGVLPQLRRAAQVVRRDEEVVGARDLAAALDAW